MSQCKFDGSLIFKVFKQLLVFESLLHSSRGFSHIFCYWRGNPGVICKKKKREGLREVTWICVIFCKVLLISLEHFTKQSHVLLHECWFLSFVHWIASCVQPPKIRTFVRGEKKTQNSHTIRPSIMDRDHLMNIFVRISCESQRKTKKYSFTWFKFEHEDA